MAKLVKPHAFRAVLFADGPRGAYFQEWQSQKYPSLFIRVHGNKKGGNVARQVFVKKRDLEVLSFKSVEDAIPSAKKHNWNPYEQIASANPSRKDRSDRKVLVLDRRAKRKAHHDVSTDVENRRSEKASRGLAIRKKTRKRS